MSFTPATRRSMNKNLTGAQNMEYAPLYKALLLSFGIAAAIGMAGCGKTDQSRSTPATQKPAAQTSTHADEKIADKKRETGLDASHAEARQLKLTAAEVASAGIKVVELREEEVNEQVVVTATVEANQDRLAHVAPRVSSRIVKVFANLGDNVKQGQTLAILDSLELGEVHSSYLKSKTEAALSRKNFERAERLFADQIIPQKDYLRASAEFEISAAALRAAADKLRLLSVDPDKLSTHAAVSVFPLTSPFSGTVTEKHAILGELAQPDKSLFTIADLATLWIEANLFEKDLGKVRVGSKASIAVNAYPGETFAGRLAYISSTVNKETRTIKVRIEVPNRDGKLKPEMFANAAIDTPARIRALFVPDDAVLLMQGQPTVFVQDGDGFEPRAVDLGEKLRGRTILKAGVKVGEKLVISGAYALKAKLLKSQIGDAH